MSDQNFPPRIFLHPLLLARATDAEGVGGASLFGSRPFRVSLFNSLHGGVNGN